MSWESVNETVLRLGKDVNEFEHDEIPVDESYKEIFKLEQMLLESNIPYRLRRFWDGWQIGYPELPPDTECICSIIQHCGSYGHAEDLLEIKGLVPGDDVDGWLSAEEVFNRISKHYKGCVMTP